MAVVNEVTLIGNLGGDPELKQTPSGSKVANFSLATTERYNDQQGNKQEKTEWHSIVAWNRQAEVLQQYAKKGDSIYIKGSLSTRSWDDATSGQKRYKTEIVVRSFQFLGSPSGTNPEAKKEFDSGQNQGYSAPSQPSEGLEGYAQPSDNLPF